MFFFLRLFLAINPNQGELSRAMRNRCLEIHIPSKEVPSTNHVMVDDVMDDDVMVDDVMSKGGIPSVVDEWQVICESKALTHQERDVCYQAYGK